MAYVVELDEEGAADTDIPTTLTRSKADVPEADEGSSAASGNDLVLDKLAQIFSYLRHGRHRKTKKTKVNPDTLFSNSLTLIPFGSSEK